MIDLIRIKGLNEDALPHEMMCAIVRAAISEFGQDLIAVLISGSRIRGTFSASSDVDVHIVFSGSWQQKRFIGADTSGFRIAIDLAVDPIKQVFSWVGKSRAYADYYVDAICIYPAPVPSEIEFLSRLAARTLAEPVQDIRESEQHVGRYRHIRRIFDNLSTTVNDVDCLAGIAYACSQIALLRLALAGVHHILYHQISTQLRAIDPLFCDAYDKCLEELSPSTKIARGIILLDSIGPVGDIMVGHKS